MGAVASGTWMMVYDPARELFVTTDASGTHGMCGTAYQIGPDGAALPIGYYSKGWQGPQIHWTAQVKECYARYWMITKIMPMHFPFARVVALCDNKNLATEAASVDVRVIRWKMDIANTGCVENVWIPGVWNTIADYGSRAVNPDLSVVLSPEDKFQMTLYMLDAERGTEMGEGEASATTVLAHLPLAPMAARIAKEQAAATTSERESWTGEGYSEANIAGFTLSLYKGRLIVPAGATEIKSVLMRMAHDDVLHYGATQQPLQNLLDARVHWTGIAEDVKRYVDSCGPCQFTKTRQKPAPVGHLEPTVPPYVHHTWYCDHKGPMPSGGYLLSVVEGVSRFVRLRYVKTVTAKDTIAALEDCIACFGTRTKVLRSDGGPPFDSEELTKWADGEGIKVIIGVPHHSQGPGKVESRFRSLTSAIIATLGANAPTDWAKGCCPNWRT